MLKVAFDVDGTLIHQIGEREDTPRYEIIDLFKKFESLGCVMYIWSGGGEDYAARWRDKLGLSAVVVAKGSFQPDIAVDDMDVTLGKVNLKV
jgi:predicted HAD superfamily phosphohydrolase YqeG